MTFAQILFTKEDHLGLIMLHRPERLNAWTSQMMEEMQVAITECNADPAIGAIVISGTGRAFCAGADITQFQQRLDAQEADKGPATAPRPTPLSDWIALLANSKPTVAAVNGAAVGVGVTQLLPMDVRVCSDQAKFGFFFVNMGITPELGSSALLPQLVGVGRAREWCLTGRFILPEEAIASGLVTHVFPHAQLLAQAKELAHTIAGKSRTALMAIKGLLDHNAFATDLAAVQQREAAALSHCFQSWEHKEAVAAFLEKRAPDFLRPQARS